MAQIGRLVVVIGSEVSGLIRGVRQAESAVEGMAFAVARSVRSLATIGVAATVAGAGLLTWVVKGSLAAIDAQSKLATRLGTSVVSIQNLKHAADLADVSFESMAQAMSVMQARMSQAAREGTGPAAEAMRRLGLSTKDLLALPVDERIARIGEAFQRLNYSTAQQAATLRELGIRNQSLILLFQQGGDAIRSAQKEVELFGIALSNIDAKAVEETNDAWTRVMAIAAAAGNQLAVAVAPILKEIADRIIKAAEEFGGFDQIIQEGVRTAVMAFGSLLRVFYNLRVGFGEFANYVITELNQIIQGLNRVTSFWSLGFAKPLDEIQTKFKTTREELGDPPDPEEWRKWYDDLVRGWNLVGEAADKASKAGTGGGGEENSLTAEKRKAMDQQFRNLQRSIANEAQALGLARAEELRRLAEFEQYKIGTQEERNAARLAIEQKYQEDRAKLIAGAIDNETLTETEKLAKRQAEQLKQLQQFEQARIITEQEAAMVRRRLAESHALAMMQLQSRQYTELANIVDTSMGHIKQIVGQEGGAAFEILKAISMATALVKGYEAVVSAYAAGSALGGPPVGAAFAAIAAAGVGAQIAALAAVKPEGAGVAGGGLSAAAGGGAAAAATSAAAPGPNAGQTLYIEGVHKDFMYGGESVRRLAEGLMQYQRDGGKVVFAR